MDLKNYYMRPKQKSESPNFFEFKINTYCYKPDFAVKTENNEKTNKINKNNTFRENKNKYNFEPKQSRKSQSLIHKYEENIKLPPIINNKIIKNGFFLKKYLSIIEKITKKLKAFVPETKEGILQSKFAIQKDIKSIDSLQSLLTSHIEKKKHFKNHDLPLMKSLEDKCLFQNPKILSFVDLIHPNFNKKNPFNSYENLQKNNLLLEHIFINRLEKTKIEKKNFGIHD